MLKKLFYTLLQPRSESEDGKRREFILNILLAGAIFLFAAASIVSLVASLIHPESYEKNSVSLILIILLLVFFLFLYFISRKGFFQISAFIFLSIFFFLSVYMGYKWGVDVNAAVLFYALTIVMSGILIHTRFAFIITGIIAAAIITIDELQRSGIISTDRYWRSEPWELTDTVMTVVIFLIIAGVSWLSNREIEKSLRRARKSEADLLHERDILEITVEERTKELRETQMEQVAQLYRFAEFGRLSSGLFHDLMNPLTAISLNIEKAKQEGVSQERLNESAGYMDKAVLAARKMEDFVGAVRKQIAKEEDLKNFSLAAEISEVMDVLSYKARAADVELKFYPRGEFRVFGDPVKWSQVALNLIANGIDAYADIPKGTSTRDVCAELREEGGHIKMEITDHAAGITPENLEKIFQPFFTTKSEKRGTGIGLSMVQRIVEKDFGGSVSVRSTLDKGTVFIVRIPKDSPHKNLIRS